MTVGRHPAALMDETVATAVDPRRWPDVAKVPDCSRARALAAEKAVRGAAARLPLRVRFGPGEVIGATGPTLQVYDMGAFFRRIGARGPLGLGESYMAREWDTDDLVAVLAELAELGGEFNAEAPQTPMRRHRRLRGRRAAPNPLNPANPPRPPSPQDPASARPQESARRHELPGRELPKELFAGFLDRTMTYSSAVFPGFPADHATLPAAQHYKIDRLLDLAAVGPGTQLLEIGTGWGELAIRAAARGARVLTVTASREELEPARWRIAQAGMAERATVIQRDFRRLLGTFDAIVSVEMIESVGEENWPLYFTLLDRMLAPGGRIALQTVTMPHDRLTACRSTPSWVRTYALPGGQIPSVEAIEQVTGAYTGLGIAAREGFGAHYAETLRLWRERFVERTAGELASIGLDETFRRMWTFHLACTEADFRSQRLDVQQLLLTRPGDAA
ncbi:cyclopropane-fatty-acyl-phospholipid synthase family protein [Streptomyces sp. NPDC051776]|uniref:cyclopropane-fatty-acyl-phospholipid synthase family protein n=1 Tax=Streptomyces sp. NPDC051776 TaxID=3155414 RepID=UPI00343E2F29